MSKKKKNGICTYCLKLKNDITDDHVFPSSWYPKSTPAHMEKWKVPACVNCNNKFSKIENDLLIRFGLCVNPSEIKSLGISNIALRSLDPRYGKNAKDIELRLKKRRKILKEIFPVNKFPKKNYFPNFGPDDVQTNDLSSAILVPHKSIISISKKIIKGLTFKLSNKYIDDKYKIDIFINYEKDVKFLHEILNKHGSKYIRGPGIEINRVAIKEDNIRGLWRINIWGRYIVYCIVNKEIKTSK